MTGRCCGCGRKIRFWQRIGFNSSWHWRCTKVWEAGYGTALKYANTEIGYLGLPSIGNLYKQRCQPKKEAL